MPRKQKITLLLTQESQRQNIMEKIMKAQGFSSQIDQYEIQKRIGESTMKAMHKKTGKQVVIKTIARELQEDVSFSEMMQIDESAQDNCVQMQS